MKEINPAQELQIARLRLASFNDMDGDVIADSMVKNRNLWDSFVVGRFGKAECDLIELRDLADGHLNVSTLLILSDKSRWEELYKVVKSKKWHANEIGYVSATDEVWGSNSYRSVKEVQSAMGGGFHVGGMWGRFHVGGMWGGDDESIPILVQVWWD